MTNLAPSPARAQHHKIRRSTNQVQDSTGAPGHPWQVEDLLDSLLAKKHIAPEHAAAGKQFAEIFAQAAITQLRAGSLIRAIGGQPGHRNPPAAEFARRKLNAALEALGGAAAPMGSIAFDVLGLQDSLGQWAIRQQWTGGRSTPAAKGVLIAALSILAIHFGLTKPMRKE